MINKQRCFLVTAYCNTSIKQKALKDTLKSLKKYNTDIILFSHYPIEKDIYPLTDYAIYDDSNPVLTHDSLDVKNVSRSMVNWKKKYTKNGLPFKINTHGVDYGYAAAQQIKRGLLLAHELGYEESFVLNYDLEVYDKMVDDFDKLLLKHDSILPIYGGEEGMYMAWFALRIKPFLNNLKSISQENYMDSIEEKIVEEYMCSKLKGENSKSIPRLEWEGPDPKNGIIKAPIIMEGDIMDTFQMVQPNYYWFTGHEILYIRGERQDTNKQLLMLWDIDENLDISIYFKDKLVNKLLIPKESDYHIIQLPITHPQFRQDHKSLKIVINDWEIPTNLLTLNMISSIEIGFYE